MKESHLTPEMLNRLLARVGDAEENRFFLHHLAVCFACYEVAGYILDLYEAGEIDLTFSTIDLALARSRAEAPRLLRELEQYPASEWETVLRDEPQFQTWGLAEALAAESVRLASVDSLKAIETAECAVLVSTLLKEDEPVEADWLEQLRAHTSAHLGNARRVFGEIRSAEDAFRDTDGHWENGASAGDALGYEAKILALKASLRLVQGRLEECLVLLDQALAAEPSPALAGSILITKGRVLEEGGDIAAAIRLHEEAAVVIDRAKHPRLYLCARHNLLDTLSKIGRVTEANLLLPEVQALAEANGDEIDLVRLTWIESRLDAQSDKPEDALKGLRVARSVFVERRMGFDAALVSLELAILLLEGDRLPEVKALAAEMYPIFSAEDIHREALAALVIFREAATRDALTLDLAKRISRYLRRSRQNPTLRFIETAEGGA